MRTDYTCLYTTLRYSKNPWIFLGFCVLWTKGRGEGETPKDLETLQLFAIMALISVGLLYPAPKRTQSPHLPSTIKPRIVLTGSSS